MSLTMSLPSELNLEVVELLPRKDLFTFSLVCRATRQLTVPSIFRDFRLTLAKHGVSKDQLLEELMNTGEDIKLAIKTLSISPSDCENANQSLKFHRLLESFSNVSSLIFDEQLLGWLSGSSKSRLSHLPSALHAVRNAPLQHLVIQLGSATSIDIPPFPGPAGLKTCTIDWRVRDVAGPGRANDYLYTFLQPSLDTLHRLSILDYDNFSSQNLAPVPSPILDFRGVRPACTQVRWFKYHTTCRDIHALGTFAEMFPNLTNLHVVFDGYKRYNWAVWTNECLQPLSLHHNLVYLTLCLDFELAEKDWLYHDNDMAWYRRCFLRRFEATKLVAQVCLQLKRCMWLQQSVDYEGNDQTYEFVIVQEGQAFDKRRVVKPVKGWWMDKQYASRHGGDLPKEIVEETGRSTCHVESY